MSLQTLVGHVGSGAFVSTVVGEPAPPRGAVLFPLFAHAALPPPPPSLQPRPQQPRLQPLVPFCSVPTSHVDLSLMTTTQRHDCYVVVGAAAAAAAAVVVVVFPVAPATAMAVTMIVVVSSVAHEPGAQFRGRRCRLRWWRRYYRRCACAGESGAVFSGFVPFCAVPAAACVLLFCVEHLAVVFSPVAHAVAGVPRGHHQSDGDRRSLVRDGGGGGFCAGVVVVGDGGDVVAGSAAY